MSGPGYPARAEVVGDFARRGVRIALAETPPGSGDPFVRIWPNDPMEMRRLDPGTQPPPDAYLFLPEEQGRALYEALAEHYGGRVDDARQLRRDYENERRRVDKVTDALITIAVGAPRA